MQAPTWTRRFEPGHVKLILVVAAVTTVLLLSALLATNLSSDDSTAGIGQTRSAQLSAMPNTRFLGWNILPGDPGTQPVTSLREYRFRDWNILPGDDAELVPPAGERGTRH